MAADINVLFCGSEHSYTCSVLGAYLRSEHPTICKNCVKDRPKFLIAPDVDVIKCNNNVAFTKLRLCSVLMHIIAGL